MTRTKGRPGLGNPSADAECSGQNRSRPTTKSHASATSPDRLSAAHTAAGKLQRACLDLLREHKRDGALPTNGRFIFYELEQRGHVPKHYQGKARTPAQDVSGALMRLRQLALVPWEWIVDESRDVDEWRSAASVYEYAVEAVENARIDCWGDELAPLVICEARSTKGVLNRIAASYLCPITATGGQCGGFLVTEVAPLLRGNDRKVLYIGDHELRGPADQIEANTRRYLQEHTGRLFDDRTWIRVALTEQQVNSNKRLLALKIIKRDNRYKPTREYEAVECEAIGQVELERMLRRQLDRMLPEPLADVLDREERQRAEVRRLLEEGAR